MTDQFDGVEINIGNTAPTHTVIWLHGLGADGNDFLPVVGELEKHDLTNLRFVFPHAPIRSVTINGGANMRAWYDIYSLDFDQRQQDSAGITESMDLVESLIERENNRGISTNNIILAGFSQGGAIALHTAIRHRDTLAGVMALSTYLPLAETVAAEKTPANQDIPVFMAHGSNDEIIASRYARAGMEALQNHKYRVAWHTYAMGHSLSMEEIIDIAKWLKSII